MSSSSERGAGRSRGGSRWDSGISRNRSATEATPVGLQHGLAVGVSVGDVGRSHGLSESSVVGSMALVFTQDSAVRASYWSADMRLSISEEV